MANELVPFERQMVLAKAFVESKLFGVTDTSQALALMALCEAQGSHPANAVQEYHIINGRPSLKADAMLTRFQRAGGSVEFTCYSDEKVEAMFKHPQGGALTVAWDMARAKRAELGGKGMWLKYPRQMLRSRVISEGVRTIFPGVLGGIYSEEEVQDFEPAVAKDVTPLKLDPRGEIAEMNAELKAEFKTLIVEHMDSIKATNLGELKTDPQAAAAWDIYRGLKDDEKMHVFGAFNTKQKDHWRKIEAVMTKKEVAA